MTSVRYELSRVIQQQPNVFSLGCICHLAALCAAAGLKNLPLSLHDLLIDIFYHFKHSSKRCAEFSLVLNDFYGIAPVRVLKHCTTRCLSLKRALNRLLLLWPAPFTYLTVKVTAVHWTKPPISYRVSNTYSMEDM